MKLFVGLGNPGPTYAPHRHNARFMATDRIPHRFGAEAWRKRFQGAPADAPSARSLHTLQWRRNDRKPPRGATTP